jgi:hypothetical protein
MTEYQHFPLDNWLLALLDGWRLPFVVIESAYRQPRLFAEPAPRPTQETMI